MIQRIKKLCKRLTHSPRKPQLQGGLSPDRLMPAALRHLEELARRKHGIDQARVIADHAGDPGDVHAENNTDIDQAIALKHHRRLVQTPNRKIIDFRQWGNC